MEEKLIIFFFVSKSSQMGRKDRRENDLSISLHFPFAYLSLVNLNSGTGVSDYPLNKGSLLNIVIKLVARACINRHLKMIFTTSPISVVTSPNSSILPYVSLSASLSQIPGRPSTFVPASVKRVPVKGSRTHSTSTPPPQSDMSVTVPMPAEDEPFISSRNRKDEVIICFLHL